MTQADHVVVVGVDHTPSTEATVRWAAEEAIREDGVLRAVHVLDVEDIADLTSASELDDPAEARTRIEQVVLEILGSLAHGIPIEYVVTTGATDEELAESARNAQVLVLGRPTSDAHWILPRRLAEECSCPVIMVDRWGAAELVSSGSTTGSP